MTLSAATLFEEALQAHMQGDLSKAKVGYERILGEFGDHAEALHHLGLIHLELGGVDTAIAHIKKSLQLDYANGAALSNLSNCLNTSGHYEQAAEAARQAIALCGSDSTAWNNLGNAQRGLGKAVESENSFRNALKSHPNNTQYIYNVALALYDQEKYQESKTFLSKALSIDKDVPEVHNNLSACLIKLGDPANSLLHAETAISLNPRYPVAWKNRGLALIKLARYADAIDNFSRVEPLLNLDPEAWCLKGDALKASQRYHESLDCFERAIEILPNCYEALTGRGIVLTKLGRFSEAEMSHDQALLAKPTGIEALIDKSYSLMMLNRLDEALTLIEKALEIDVSNADAWNNRGSILGALGSADEALICYDRAIALDPSNGDAHMNRGTLLLSNGEFGEGFVEYEWRWNCGYRVAGRWHYTEFNIHSGALKAKGSVLVLPEQGIGDEILYASLLPTLLDRGFEVTLAATEKLLPTFSRCFNNVTVHCKELASQLVATERYDYCTTSGNLGRNLSLSESTVRSSRAPYLFPCPSRQVAIREKLISEESKLTCGLAWKSGNSTFGAKKSLQLEQLSPLLLRDEFRFVNLQYGAVKEDLSEVREKLGVEVQEIAGLNCYDDIEGLLALVDLCDLVVTTSNVTAHLAGANGKKTAVLVPSGVGRIWYWRSIGKNSLWYPSVTLFEQEKGRVGWGELTPKLLQWALGESETKRPS